MQSSSDTPQAPHTVESLLRVVEARESEVAFLKLMVDKLKLQLLKRARSQFGPSSEQFQDPQIALIEGQPLDEQAVPKARAKLPAANAPEIDRTLPSHLPREARHYRPETTAAHLDTTAQPCGCTACGGRLRQIGQDVSEQLEYVAARFKVIRHVRAKLACVSCQAIFQAAAPSRPIARGMAGPGLLAHVMVSKYCDHTPLYRQSGIYAREGVHIDRSTMAGWVDQGDALLDPLVAALGRYALAGAKVHADDTPVKVLDPGRGRTKTGRLWVYVRDDRPAASADAPAVWFRYSPDRKGEHPQGHLNSFSGILQADAYGGWGKLYESGRVREAACWAHARRPFWDLHLSLGRAPGTLAEQALQRIAALYKIEADIRGQVPEERRRQRQARAGPLLKELHAWLSAMVGRVSAKSDLAAAIGYSLTRWQALTRYLDDGRIEIDNNAAERALRGVSLGRKNYLFMGSDAGGERAAAIYSLVETAKLNGLDPECYLREVGPYRRSSDQPHRRVAAVEHRPTGRCPTTSRLSMATRVQRIKAPARVLQLHIELRGTKPKIWRRVLVPETITLARLHGVIQAAFQWGGGHMHEFEAAGERYGTSDPDYDPPGSVRSERIKLTSALGRGSTIDYLYGFGDSWEHRIKLEKVLAPMDMKLPVCVDGANAAPPDDCGGVPGYEEFVEAMVDPNHPEHADMKAWIGRDWDPAVFDIEHINSWLAEIKL